MIDFSTTNGGYTNQNIVGSNPWDWIDGQGWTVSGLEAPAGLRSRLLGLAMTSSNANISVVIRHRFNFEGSSRCCFDGGLIMRRLNGGAMEQITGESLARTTPLE